MRRVLLREPATSYARVFAFLWVATREPLGKGFRCQQSPPATGEATPLGFLSQKE